MYIGPKRIFLIDSYLSGLDYEVLIDGHTNLSGTNGAGKTSLIQLIPIFYGQTPSAILKKSKNGNLGFSEYYLPKDGSYLVFEYTGRNKESKMVVFYGNPADPESFHQMFIDSPFERSLFINPETDIPYPTSTFRAKVKAHPNYLARSIAQYRRILMDGERGYERFSLVPPRSALSKLVPLFTGMLTKTADFDVLRSIVVNWTTSELDAEAQRNLHNLNIDMSTYGKWLDDYRAYILIEKRCIDIEEMKLGKVRMSELKNTGDGIYFHTLEQLIIRKEQIEEVDNQRKKQIAKYNERYEKLELQLVNLSPKIVGFKDSKQDAETELDGYKRQKNLLENKLTKEVITEVANLPLYREEKVAREGQLVKLKNESIDIDNWYLEQKELLSKSYQNVFYEVQALKDDINERYESEIERWEADYKEGIAKLDESHQIQVNLKQSEIQTLIGNIATLEAIIDNPPVQATLINKINQVQKDIDNKQQQVSDNQHEQSKIKVKCDSLDGEFNSLDGLYKRTLENLEELEKEKSELNDVIHANKTKKPFYKFIKEKVPDKFPILTSLLTRNILLSTELEPEIKGNNSTLFGISIAENKVPTNNFETDEEVLLKQLEITIEEIEEYEKKLIKINTDMDKCLKNIQQKKAETSVLEANRIALQNQIKQLFKTKRALAEEETADKNKFVAEKNIEKDTSTKHLFNLKHALKELNEEHQTSKLLQGKELEKNKLSSLSERESNLEVQRTRLESAQTKLTLDIEKLNIIRKEKLSNSGISETTLEQLEQRVDELGILITKYNKFVDIKERYELAVEKLKEEEPRLNKLIKDADQKLSDARLEQKRVNLDKDKLKVDHENEVSALDKKELGLNRDISKLDILADKCRIHGFEKKEHGLFSNLPAVIENSLDELLYDLRTQRDTLKQSTSRIIAAFKQYTGSTCYQYWMSERVDENNIYDCVDKIVKFVDEKHIDNIKDLLITNADQVAKLYQYKRVLEQIETKIKSFDKKLRYSIAEKLPFPDLSEVKPNISFSKSEISAWSYIEDVSCAYHDWSAKSTMVNSQSPDSVSRKELPHEEFVQALSALVDYADNSISHLDTDYLIDKISISVNVIEQGQRKFANVGKDLNALSSTGLSYLLLIILFLGFVNIVRGSTKLSLVWALDELSLLHSSNINHLLDLLAENNISLLSACPEINSSNYDRFSQSYTFYKQKNQSLLVGDDLSELDRMYDEILDEGKLS